MGEETKGLYPEKINWMDEFCSRLRDYSYGGIWTNGLEVLCSTKDGAETIQDLLKTLYATQGEEMTVHTGYYDPEEDLANGTEDRHTGWYWVNVEQN